MATWGDKAVLHLLDATICPRCSARLSGTGQCASCGADLAGDDGAAIWEASNLAAEAVLARQELIDALPARKVQVSEAPRVVLPARDPARDPAPAPAAQGSSVSIQSVLAVAGAGLLGVAAIVFTFLNPDLTDFATRTLIIGGTTLLFLGGAWLLARAALQFSAESVGALGVVFVALDIWAFSQLAPAATNAWWLVALGTLVGSAVLITIAVLARIRSWMLAGVLGVALVPAFVGYALGGLWFAALGHLAAAFVAFALHGLVRRQATRFGRALTLELDALGVLQIIAVPLVVVGVLAGLVESDATMAVPAAAILVALAAMAVLAARNEAPHFWSVTAGLIAVGALSLLPLAVSLDASVLIALVPAAAALAVVGLAALPLPASVDRARFAVGSWIPLLGVTLPAAIGVPLELVIPAESQFGWTLGLVAGLGLFASAAGAVGLSLLLRRRDLPVFAARALTTGLWLAALAVTAFILWGALLPLTRVALAVVTAVGMTVLLTRALRSWPSAERLPLFALAHVALLLAAVIGFTDPAIAIVSGAAVTAALVVVSRALPAPLRPLHIGASYAWGLVTLAQALTLANVDPIAVLCLTTTAASLGALAATLVHRLRAGAWYAILVVTSVPFLIGIGSVIAERSGWTALSTGVTFLLAVTLVATRRPGLNRALRTLAAALLVPALAVVVICLGAQVLLVSASPITLPIIAAIVAIALPSTTAIGRALVRRGISDADARAARIAIEVSSLVTAAIAVLLALVRAAAGLGTSFTVLVILGVGAAAAGILTRRRYAWAVSGASFTGALWSLWALVGVVAIEPYVLPPALGLALVGAVLTWRVQRGAELYFAGLVIALFAMVALVAIRPDDAGAWRVAALGVAAVLLVAVGAFAPTALRELRIPSLILAFVATLGLVVQAVRFGLDLEAVGRGSVVMVAVLGLSAIAVGLGTGAGAVLGRAVPSRWIYAPAVVFAVVGPIVAIREGWFSILAVLALSLALLALMLVTVARALVKPVTLPPVWFTFAAAWVTAVASWSERELRVEAYSLPLGLALIAAGVIASRGEARSGGTATSWPVGFAGSWRLLAPGILVTLVPSVLATVTDPRTERAILVIGLALAAILIGSLRKLAAPFILGVITLPIENLLVFVVQIGRSIGAAPWWITLATAGAVLLVIAVTSERRATGMRGVSARLRDLT